jgi:ribosomal protein S12 methylthiotransferase accessory factor
VTGRAPRGSPPGGRRGGLHRDRALLEALGITRIARVTGLDRSGVEVACAVRPLGHVLQVCNGKGESFEQAATGALLEAAELWGAERVDAAELAFGSLEEVGDGFPGEVWGADGLGSAGALVGGALWSAQTRCAWRRGDELMTGAPVLVPARAVHCPPPGTLPLGPAVIAWSSNGSGAHPNRSAALLHALLEAAERDQLARALPEGFTPERVEQAMLSPESLPKAAPRTAAWVDALGARGFDAHLFDLSFPGTLGLPVAGALLVERARGPVSLTAGYACALERDRALLAALLEAAQSRLTDIHGAREDVQASDEQADEALIGACRRARARRRAQALPQLRSPRDGGAAGAAGAVREVLARFRAAGFERAAAFDLAPSGFALHVVKVVVPGMQVSELL